MRARVRHPFGRLFGRRTTALWVMVAGGALWILHGYFRFATPHGPDAVWREDLGYSPIVSTGLFLLYNLPGCLALLLTSWATLSFLATLRAERTRLHRAAEVLAIMALLLGVTACAGLVLQLAALTTGGISLGTPALGLSLLLAGLTAADDDTGLFGSPSWLRAVLMAVGAIGIFTLPLQPLMYAFGLLPLAFGTAVFALFGAGWVVLGIGLRPRRRWRRGEHHGTTDP